MKSVKSTAIVVFTVLVLAAMATTSFAAGNDEEGEAKLQASTNYARAVTAVKSGKYEKAIKLLAEVLRVKPRDANALNYMGYSQRKTGKFDKAIVFYKRALAEEPNHLGANEYLGEAYLETGKLSEAERRLAQLKSACGGCEEYQDLKKAVAAYKTKQ